MSYPPRDKVSQFAHGTTLTESLYGFVQTPGCLLGIMVPGRWFYGSLQQTKVQSYSCVKDSPQRTNRRHVLVHCSLRKTNVARIQITKLDLTKHKLCTHITVLKLLCKEQTVHRLLAKQFSAKDKSCRITSCKMVPAKDNSCWLTTS